MACLTVLRNTARKAVAPGENQNQSSRLEITCYQGSTRPTLQLIWGPVFLSDLVVLFNTLFVCFLARLYRRISLATFGVVHGSLLRMSMQAFSPPDLCDKKESLCSRRARRNNSNSRKPTR